MPHTEPSPPAADPRRFHRRRLVQFRLRTLFVITGVCAVLFSLCFSWQPLTPLPPGLPTAQDVVVTVIDAPLPADADKRETFLWDRFANQPDEQKFNAYTVTQARDHAPAFAASLVGKAKEQKLDSAALQKALQHVGDLPVGAYQTTRSGKPVWIITAKWEHSRDNGDLEVAHIKVYASDSQTSQLVGYVQCN